MVDRPRLAGRSHYGLFDRLWVGILDLVGVWWLIRRRKRVPSREEMPVMLIRLSSDLGAYFYDVFVTRFDFWLGFGVIAQLLFALRFVVQWLASERAGKQRHAAHLLVLFHGRRRC